MQNTKRRRSWGIGQRNPDTLPSAGSTAAGYESWDEMRRNDRNWRSLRRRVQAGKLTGMKYI